MSTAPGSGGEDRQPHIGVVGAGILGTVLALRLAQGGARVTLLERAPTPGGLAGAFDFGGHRVDRFYHVIVPSDERMISLTDELGLSDRLSFTPVGVGFFIDGEMHPLTASATSCASRRSPRSGARASPGSYFSASCAATTARSSASPSNVGSRATAGARSWSASGGRCSTRASTPTTVSCPPPTSGPAPTACAPLATG